MLQVRQQAVKVVMVYNLVSLVLLLTMQVAVLVDGGQVQIQ